MRGATKKGIAVEEYNKLKHMFDKGALSRRDFMAGVAMIGAGMAVTPTLLSGTAQAAAPKVGGNFIIGMEGGSATDSLDPRTYADSVMIGASLAVYNCMVEFDANGNPTGELLESWEAKPGAKEWVFNVRKGVKFSNGKALTADDILYSIAIHRGHWRS